MKSTKKSIEVAKGLVAEHRRLEAYHRDAHSKLGRNARVLKATESSKMKHHGNAASAIEQLIAKAS